MFALNKDQLFASALGAVTDRTVVTFEDHSRGDFDHKLVPGFFHRLTLQRTVVPYVPKPVPNGDEVVVRGQILVKDLTGGTTVFTLVRDETVEGLKTRIHDRLGIPEDQQRLLFGGHQLEDGRTLSDYKIERDSTIQVVLRLRGGAIPKLYMAADFRDKQYDYDFTNVLDTETFLRGAHEYKRPCGWMRLAVNVKGYGDDTWLGTTRKTSTESVSGEWPVSYHGTGKHHAKSIAQQGYDLSKGKRSLYGTGIYSTPDISIAALYAKCFTLGWKRYMVVVQNRVNPEAVKKIPGQTTGVGEYWLTEKEEDTRAYGICIKQVKRVD